MNYAPSFESLLYDYRQDQRGMGWGFDDLFSDIGESFTDAIAGLSDAIGGALTATLQAVEHLGETIALIVRASIGDVSWDAVLGELGKIFQDIGTIIVYLNPNRGAYDWLQESPITSHAFNELDKFSGGMITTAKNISTLPGRAMRGDAITKQELIQDVMFGIQVILIATSGGAYLAMGMMLGTMVGNQVCSKQTEHQDACMVAFQIVGAAAGQWSANELGLNVVEAGISQAEQQAFLQGPEAYAQYMARQGALTSTSFVSQLSTATQNYMTTAGIDKVTQRAVALCQSGKIVGSRECEILGQIVSDYVKAPSDIKWVDFLANEIVSLGQQELLLQWFPPDSPEAQAIKIRIKYVDVPGGIVRVKKFDPKTLLLIAGGVAAVVMGVAT